MSETIEHLRQLNSKYLEEYPDSPYWFSILSPLDREYGYGVGDLEVEVFADVFDDTLLSLEQFDKVSLVYNYLLHMGDYLLDHECHTSSPIIVELTDRLYEKYSVAEDARDFLNILTDKYVIMIFDEGTANLKMICVLDHIGYNELRYIPIHQNLNTGLNIHPYVIAYLTSKYPHVRKISTVLKTHSPLIPTEFNPLTITPVIRCYSMYNVFGRISESHDKFTYNVDIKFNTSKMELETVLLGNRDIRLNPITLSTWNNYLPNMLDSYQHYASYFRQQLIANPYFKISAIIETIHRVTIPIGIVAYTIHPTQMNKLLHVNIIPEFQHQGIGSSVLKTIGHQLNDMISYPIMKVMVEDKHIPFFKQAGFNIDSCELIVYQK